MFSVMCVCSQRGVPVQGLITSRPVQSPVPYTSLQDTSPDLPCTGPLFSSPPWSTRSNLINLDLTVHWPPCTFLFPCSPTPSHLDMFKLVHYKARSVDVFFWNYAVEHFTILFETCRLSIRSHLDTHDDTNGIHNAYSTFSGIPR